MKLETSPFLVKRMDQKRQQQLRDVGSKLENPPATKDALVKLLKQAATCLTELDQSPSASILESLQPSLNAIVKPELLKHQDRDVKLLVATCICEITRITAPEAPYSDDVLKDIFRLIVSTFSGLSDTNGPAFGRRVVILETLARYRSCVVMLDLECDDLVNEMFRTFFSVARDDHPESVLTSMQTIMVVLLEESEDVREDLLFSILSILGRNKSDVTTAARRLAMNVIEHCAAKLEPGIKQFLVSSISGDNRSMNSEIDYHEVIYDIYRCAPQILSGVTPYLTGELLTDNLDTRLKAVKLVGDLFALPGLAISEAFQPIFSEFLKRLADRVVGVRMSVLEHVKSCLLSNPSRAEAPQIISALCDRLLDYDENVRKQVVAVICDVACHSLSSIPVETAKLVAERLRDKSVLVKKYTLERLAEIYNLYCLRCCDGSLNPSEFDWIPGKILRCFYDKDFRSDTIESVLCETLFPTEFSIKDKVKHWVRVFSGFDKVEVKALEKILEQKQRLQQEMQRYLSLKQMHQDGEGPEIQKKVTYCLRIMSRLFADPAKAEENFQILDQLKDVNIWKILSSLIDPKTSFHQACSSRDDLLRILGEKHRLYDFLGTLSLKCSYLLFNKEHVKEFLLEAAIQKSSGNTQYIQSCMNVLVVLARFSPLLLSGAEEDLVHLLKDDNEIIKEGVLHILAKAGGTIREQLAVTSSSVDLILERLCLEGSRRQAKYAVHALAAITKDDGLKSLSVLYKRLVDMLDKKTHLPAVLQSLGCIAQTAMPVFETRESEIEGFIKCEILKCSSKAEDNAKACWDDRSELCLLKIFGIKTMVKSYLPVKDAHLRLGIDDLLEILKNILLFGEISKDIESSAVDKAHLRLAAAKAILRLARHWDHKIPVGVFHLTLRTSESSFPQAKKLFLSKVHQYIKDRLLDAKYACAFSFNIVGSQPSEFEEDKHNLGDIIQMYHQAKARQLSTQSDASSLAYPEFILPYLVHALAHHSCPDIDECKDVKAFEPIYWKLHIFLSMLVHGDEDTKAEAGADKEKEGISAIISIFQSIKLSEDIVDAAKSKNSHALCDLGLSIIKRLVQKQDDVQGLTSSITLPPILYKLCEKEGDDSVASEGQTWLADESVLTHFESLKLETNGMVDEEGVINDNDRDGNELPLGKMIKRLKSRGTKSRKVKNKKSSPAKKKHAENDVDILKMVREINFDAMGMSSKFESSNGHEYSSHRKSKMGQKHEKKKRRRSTEVTPVTVPKRRRSSSAKSSLPRSASKGSVRALRDNLHQAGVSSFQSTDMDSEVHTDSEDKVSALKNIGEPAESDLLVSCFRRNSNFLSKRKGKGSDKGDNDEARIVGEDKDHDLRKPNVPMETDKIHTASNVKSPTGSTKKRKRRSIAGLAKSTSKEGRSHAADLIDCRIKVWWPMDKQFYEGVVKSYDPKARKHVVLYDDGDVEVLRLARERWELVENVAKPAKKLNSSKTPPSKGVSADQKNKFLNGSQQNKKPIKSSSSKVRGKRTPRKNLKHVEKAGLESNTATEFCEVESRGSSDVSNPEPNAMSKVEDMNSGDSEEKLNERSEKGLTGGEESDKEEKSVSEGKQVEDKEKRPSDTEESEKEEKPYSEGRPVEDKEGICQDAQESPEKKESYSEEREPEESKRDSPSGEEANKEEQSDSEETQAENLESNPTDMDKSSKKTSDPSNTEDAKNSDDEPLSMWKRRVGKPV